ncbi:MAG: YciK family oxidoreductase [Gammaproteobacteria bacterium]|nr:YciK family oxidoreductase [Gammaproteobacteria bacterium]
MHDYEPAPALLQGRVILVTGAGRGIGRTAALTFATHGATTVLLGRKVPALESLYDDILAAGGPQPAIYPLDLLGANPSDYADMAGRLGGALGHLDGLLLNAGQLGTLGPLEHSDPEEFVRVLHVNLTANYLLCRACLPLMRQSADASIVLISSDVGRKGAAYWGAYSISKHGIEGLTQVLAGELEQTQVRVNALNPGAVRTAMRANAYPAEDRRGLPEPQALMVPYLYLLGPDSKGVTGNSFDAQPQTPKS